MSRSLLALRPLRILGVLDGGIEFKAEDSGHSGFEFLVEESFAGEVFLHFEDGIAGCVPGACGVS